MNAKKCVKCKKIKDVVEFEHWRNVCKKCRATQVRDYLRKHKGRQSTLFKQWLSINRSQRKQYCKEWYRNNKKYYLKYKSKYRKLLKKSKPWLIVLQNIRCRLANSVSKVGSESKHRKNKAYCFINNYLTGKDIKFLWFRDKAYLMKRPSIHKKNNKNHYTLDNCKFLELSEHNHLKKKDA